MAPPSHAREWLPSCFDSSAATSSTKKPGYVTRATSRIDGVIAPVRENAQTASGADTCCPNLSFKDRVQGCLACFGFGVIISFLSFLSWWGGQIATFAIFYTFGNIVAICGSGFLMGPKRQCRNMTRARRLPATGMYVLMMILTLTLACMDAPAIFVLFCVFCRAHAGDLEPAPEQAWCHAAHRAPACAPPLPAEWCALVWYIASYIPYGQKMIKKFCVKITDF